MKSAFSNLKPVNSVPEGEKSIPEGEISVPEGGKSNPESEISIPEGEKSIPEGEVSIPEGEISAPEGEVSTSTMVNQFPQGDIWRGMCFQFKNETLFVFLKLNFNLTTHVNQQNRNIRRRHPADAAGLPDGMRAYLAQFLTGLFRHGRK